MQKKLKNTKQRKNEELSFIIKLHFFKNQKIFSKKKHYIHFYLIYN